MDKALDAYEEASKLASDGKIDFQMAYIYFEREEWQESKAALKSALEKGGLKDKKVGQAWLLLGMLETELKNNSGAIKALKNASKYKNTRNNAVQWLDHIEKQRKQAKALAEQERMLADQAKNEEES